MTSLARQLRHEQRRQLRRIGERLVEDVGQPRDQRVRVVAGEPQLGVLGAEVRGDPRRMPGLVELRFGEADRVGLDRPACSPPASARRRSRNRCRPTAARRAERPIACGIAPPRPAARRAASIASRFGAGERIRQAVARPRLAATSTPRGAGSGSVGSVMVRMCAGRQLDRALRRWSSAPARTGSEDRTRAPSRSIERSNDGPATSAFSSEPNVIRPGSL